MTLVFPVNARAVDFKSAKDRTYAIRENSFGDGYVQRSADGLNNVRATWNVSWTNLTTAEKDVIEQFLDSTGGWQPFTWTAPGDSSPKKWIVKNPKINPVDAGYWNIAAQFIQDFSL